MPGAGLSQLTDSVKLVYIYTGKQKAVVAYVIKAVCCTGTREEPRKQGRQRGRRRGSVPFGQDHGWERERRGIQDQRGKEGEAVPFVHWLQDQRFL